MVILFLKTWIVLVNLVIFGYYDYFWLVQYFSVSLVNSIWLLRLILVTFGYLLLFLKSQNEPNQKPNYFSKSHQIKPNLKP